MGLLEKSIPTEGTWAEQVGGGEYTAKGGRLQSTVSQVLQSRRAL